MADFPRRLLPPVADRAVAPRVTEFGFVYALGRLQPQFSSLAVEKEWARATGDSASALTDRAAWTSVLADDAHRYLAPHLCWTFLTQGVERFVLAPAPDWLTTALTESGRGEVVDLLVGLKGPASPPSACGGRRLPIVRVAHLLTFETAALLARLLNTTARAKQTRGRLQAGEALFNSIVGVANNTGEGDLNRALNYVAVRYPGIYTQAVAESEQGGRLVQISGLPSNLSGDRQLTDVQFTYVRGEERTTVAYTARVDTTEEFPFLQSELQPMLPA